MKCIKCGNELKENDNFCTKCGTAVESSIEAKISNAKNKYILQKNYDVMWGMVGLAFIINVAFWVAGLGFCIPIIIIELVAYGILVAIGAFSNMKFKCPNCKEEVILNQNIPTMINDNESSCKCPKCSKELIFNNKELSVKINTAVENIQNNNSNKDDTEKLEEWFNLKTKGIISEEEFEAKKQEILKKS